MFTSMRYTRGQRARDGLGEVSSHSTTPQEKVRTLPDVVHHDIQLLSSSIIPSLTAEKRPMQECATGECERRTINILV